MLNKIEKAYKKSDVYLEVLSYLVILIVVLDFALLRLKKNEFHLFRGSVYLIQSLRLLQIEPLFTLFRGSVLEVSYTLSYSYTSNS